MRGSHYWGEGERALQSRSWNKWESGSREDTRSLFPSLVHTHARIATVKECVCVVGARKSKTLISVCSVKPVKEYTDSKCCVLLLQLKSPIRFDKFF